ncbi:hypothetical protein [Bordetella avium]|uniref:Type IV pilus assembly protein n=1 Tax=Bordetella avium (strain 197N) TaxID=360910 RepID=Q2KY66_BORA1|nr:hypothetical protein [Bordetella avium]AZY53090.1 pilus assembly protein [Bordetella avium]RIQ12568.1 pilus assembly protein [Bordetella avium]RIQ17658.1 pilus assembly protein [Bordetella avium]RIQ32314.1 pilus assembly protein [Bordetella avium]RIQ37197.1 pilus assembly protein [Bordetella avium]
MRESWIQLRLDAWRFQRARADYYAYLGALLQASEGRVALRDIFANDLLRYGPGNYRGRLGARWASACGTHGGDLAVLWTGVAPAQDCLLLATAQSAGSAALAQSLLDLAQASRLADDAWRQIKGAVLAVALALTVLIATLWALPLFTVPHLVQVFADLPAAYYGPWTRALTRFAGHMVWAGPLSAVLAAASLAVWLWSFGRWRGALRSRFDRVGPWRLYRDSQAIRFLSLLEVLIRDRGAIDARLRAALKALRQYALPWLAGHIDEMLARIDRGEVQASTFNTGLLDRQLWWFMSDMMAAHGIEAGLSRARQRIEQAWLPQLAAQVLFWRWLLLLGTVLCMLALVFWHYGVIDELRRGLGHFYSSH